VTETFKTIAIVSAFNEGDVISPIIGHLVENGLEVYLLDNHSTDDTVQQASAWLGRGLLAIEPFPSETPPESRSRFEWHAILHRKEELASELEADWFIHHDADEVRYSPWPAVSLQDAIRWVDALGYNCIDFRAINLPPVDDGFRQGLDPRSYFHFWEEAAEYDRMRLNCWKASDRNISLADSAGHEVRFDGRNVFPIEFLLCHYPIRGQTHGMRKVYRERKARFLESERKRGWHIQYDDLREDGSFIADPATLKRFDLNELRLELMLRNTCTVALEKRCHELEERARDLEDRLRLLRLRTSESEARRNEMEQREIAVLQELKEVRERVSRVRSDVVGDTRAIHREDGPTDS
jgi:hypothetical protein